jgi:hypothetical protein
LALDPHLKFEQGSSPKDEEPPLLNEDPAELNEEPTAGALLKEPLLKDEPLLKEEGLLKEDGLLKEEEEPPKSLDPVTIVWRLPPKGLLKLL